jgi:hypothetical protein
MFSAIGSLLRRKPAPTNSTPVARPNFPPSGSASSMRRRQEDPRDTYSRVFRWKAGGECGEPPVSVEIVGSFTRWQTISLTHDPVQDTWSVTVQGIPGKRTHHYMLLINGKPVHDPACDGLAQPMGFDEEQFALQTDKGPRVLMLFAQTK